MLLFISLIALFPLFLGYIFEGYIYYLTYQPHYPFDKTAWHQDKQKRYQIADDLVNKKILLRKDTAYVRSLLGAPEYRNTISEWEYDAGAGAAGLGFTFHFLNLNIQDGKVISVTHGWVRD